MPQSPSHHRIPGQILDAVSRIVVGKDEVKRLLLTALLSGGHVLIEGMAGTAKTLLGRSFAQAMGGEFRRIQLTPDLLPTDVTGFYLYRPDGSSQFIRGPIFANVVLADELNRTTPRTQAAFLEAMQERQVTIEGTTHRLAAPFMVIATQLPSGGPGTYPLTDVQVDRFMFRAWSDYPTADEEARVAEHIDLLDEPHVEAVAAPDTILALQAEVRRVHVSDEVRRYIVAVVNAIRHDPDVLIGPSPRGTIALLKGSRVLAFLEGRDFVVPDDVKALAVPALAHRIHMKSEAEMDGVTPQTLVEKALRATAVPRPA
ncbi:MAG: MoxR family ATPase [Armatimonadota bacterium]|nr:MoxR family ATPase [Armatimonadota bacterium]MDR7553863.1 MoxR family ATPase [Armatimonadota bacterium]